MRFFLPGLVILAAAVSAGVYAALAPAAREDRGAFPSVFAAPISRTLDETVEFARPLTQLPEPPAVGKHGFYFTRAAYGSAGEYRFSRWRTDYPKADRQFLFVLQRLVDVDAYARENPVRLDDPNLRRFPFLYMLEVGYMRLSDAEVRGLRDYLLAGGFLMVDDFWGTYQWRSFEEQMQRVLPEFPIVDLPLSHPIFSSFYDVTEILQVPNVGNAIAGGATHERDGYVPVVRGIFDDRNRLMVAINWNTDIGDAWEHAENPGYPLKYSTFAYQMGANFIVYAMSH